MKKLSQIFLFLALIGIGIFSINYYFLKLPFSSVIDAESRNKGINADIHYQYYVVPSTLVFNIKDISGEKSPADVFRVFLQFSAKLKDRNFEKIVLANKGKEKFYLSGEYFRTLGQEFGTQNPIYTIRTFPENLYKPDGTKAFGSWSGGLLGVVKEQMNDFLEFHKQWYIYDGS